MESSPLTQAHLHARNAVSETRKSNPVAASEEHDLAAGGFAHAAQTTGDPEALRTLKLLEEHHKKLAQILKFRHDHPLIPKSPEVSATSSPPPAPDPPISTKPSPTLVEQIQHPPRLPPQNRIPHRDLTSSIASNLATARGIPPNQHRRPAPASPTLSAQHAGGKMHGGVVRDSSGEPKQQKDSPQVVRGEATRQPRSTIPPPILSPSDQLHPMPTSPSEQQRSHDDEPFQRFYSTFEGLIAKLSAPLAFAGLPLAQPSLSTPELNQKSKQSVTSATPQAQDPELTQLISPAALQAVKDTNSPGSFGYSAAESFYVVPTTGGTASYAKILTRLEQETLRQTHAATSDAKTPTPFFKEINSDDDEGDADFVDARETPSQNSPELNRPQHGRTKSGATTVGGKTMEELHLENKALKHLSDTLSKRLHMWEVNAQSSSAALQQSLRALQNSPKAVAVDAQTLSGEDGMDGGALKRLQELEEMAKQADSERERADKENEKLKAVVNRYRERWEKLKEGARVRREGASPVIGNEGSSTPINGLENER